MENFKMKLKMFLAIILGLFASSVSFAALNNANQTQVSVIELGDLTATGDVYGIYLPKKSKIVSVVVVDGTGIAASDTNYAQVALSRGSNVIAELDTRAAHEGALVANTPKAANIVAAQQIVPKGSYLKATFTKAGTAAIGKGKVIVEWYPY